MKTLLFWRLHVAVSPHPRQPSEPTSTPFARKNEENKRAQGFWCPRTGLAFGWVGRGAAVRQALAAGPEIISNI